MFGGTGSKLCVEAIAMNQTRYDDADLNEGSGGSQNWVDLRAVRRRRLRTFGEAE